MKQIIFDIFVSTWIILLLGYSFKIIYNVTRYFHLAHAISVVFGAYVIYTLSVICCLSFEISIVISVFVPIGIMLLVNEYVYEKLHLVKVENWQIMIASLGVYVIFQNLISVIWGDQYLSFRSWNVAVGYNIYEIYMTEVQLITVFVSIILLGLSDFFFRYSNYGKKLNFVSSNPELSPLLGISKHGVTVIAYILGSSMAAIGGILIAADSDLNPSMGFNWLIYAVVAMIIGGMGKMRYLFLGALLLASGQHLAAYYLDSKWMNAVAYIILIAFLYFRPYGFSGKKVKKVEV